MLPEEQVAEVEQPPKSRVVSCSVPAAVADALRDEAVRLDRSVSWVINRILTEWYRSQPGAQVEMQLVAPEPSKRRVGL